jgi:hypothetical protein
LARTHFQEFRRDSGATVTVEYSYSPGSETSYSPHSGASGGDPAEVEIVAAFDESGGVALTDHEKELFGEWILAHCEPDYDEPEDWQ